MAVLYVIEQGATLHKRGNRIVVEKFNKEIDWIHAFKVEQIIIVGNIMLSPHMIAFLLKEGIDTVFLSMRGKYRGRLISQFGKNVILRQIQFRKMDDKDFILNLAKRYVSGKLRNYRTLLRRHNRDLKHSGIEDAIHKLRNMINKIEKVDTLESLRGIEGKGTNIYFQGFKYSIRGEGLSFETRSRRPPRDAVNALLSFGYTLLGNTIQTALNIVGLDPYLGCLHAVDYGRPSLVLDLMEEFRPVLVDSLILRLINRKVITSRDFYHQEDVRLPEEGEELEELDSSDYPVLLTHEGMKKWIVHYEKHLNERIYYIDKSITYKEVCIEQARLLVRYLKGEDNYTPFLIR